MKRSQKMPQKTCNGCFRQLPLAQFNKNGQQRDGLTGKCKECLSVVRKVWDRKYNQSAKAKEAARRYYYSEIGQENKKAYRKGYSPTPEQRDLYRLAARIHEKEARYKARRKRYDNTEKGKTAKANRDRRYFVSERGRFTKQKIEIKRKRQLMATECSLTIEQWNEIKARHHHRCAYCGKAAKRLEKDHIRPLARGGHHTAENIAPACRTCNARKGDRLPNELSAQFGMSPRLHFPKPTLPLSRRPS